MDSTRKCSCCQAYKEKSCFAFKNKTLGKLQSQCKECRSKYHKSYYESNRETYCQKARSNNTKYKKRNRDFVSHYKSEKGCKFCKENSAICLDFHHKDPKIKDWNISIMCNGSSSIETIKAEMKKCIVICSNCHRKLHAGLISRNKK